MNANEKHLISLAAAVVGSYLNGDAATGLRWLAERAHLLSSPAALLAVKDTQREAEIVSRELTTYTEAAALLACALDDRGMSPRLDAEVADVAVTMACDGLRVAVVVEDRPRGRKAARRAAKVTAAGWLLVTVEPAMVIAGPDAVADTIRDQALSYRATPAAAVATC